MSNDSKKKESAIRKLLRVLGLVRDKKKAQAQKYDNYNVGQLRPINNSATVGHTGYLITKKGTGKNAEFGYVSITHSKTFKDKKTKKKFNNIPLSQNPNPKDKKPSYAIDNAKKEKAKNIGKIKTGWKLNKKDKKLLKKIFYKNLKENK